MLNLDDTFECSTHDDDSVYDISRCKEYDKHLCDGKGTDWDSNFPVACEDLWWCRHFCGNECERGKGGLCLLKLVSSLGDTCGAVSKRVVALRGDPGRNNASHAFSSTQKNPYFQHTDAIDNGCGYHALCSECKGDCLVPVVQVRWCS